MDTISLRDEYEQKKQTMNREELTQEFIEDMKQRELIPDFPFWRIVPNKYGWRDGHTLITPRRYFEYEEQMTEDECIWMLKAKKLTRAILKSRGYNNFLKKSKDGPIAEQNILIYHHHIIPVTEETAPLFKRVKLDNPPNDISEKMALATDEFINKHKVTGDYILDRILQILAKERLEVSKYDIHENIRYGC